MQPGSIGATMNMSNGEVTDMVPDGQAFLGGVKVGWRLYEIAEEPYSEERFESFTTGPTSYTVVFDKDVSASDILPISPVYGKAIAPATASAASASMSGVAGSIRQSTKESTASGDSGSMALAETGLPSLLPPIDSYGKTAANRIPTKKSPSYIRWKRSRPCKFEAPPIGRVRGASHKLQPVHKLHRWKLQLPITIEAVRDARSLFYRGEREPPRSEDEDHNKHVRRLYLRLATDPTRMLTSSMERQFSSSSFASLERQFSLSSFATVDECEDRLDVCEDTKVRILDKVHLPPLVNR
jgi:hypothetical protein